VSLPLRRPRRSAPVRATPALRHRVAAVASGAALLAVGATAGLAGSVVTAPAASAATYCGNGDFRDVSATKDPTYYPAVSWLSCEKITTGYSDGTFRLTRSVSRGEIAEFLYRQVTPKHPTVNRQYFHDVPYTGRYYSDSVTWMAQAGLSMGNSDRTYRPENAVTRGELAAFLYRLAGSSYKAPSSSYGDMNPSSSFYHEAHWLKASGIASGYRDKRFRADQPITRGETAIMLKNANKYIAHRGNVSQPVLSPISTGSNSGSAVSTGAAQTVKWATATANNPNTYYKWGGNGPLAFDCSGFTVGAFAAGGTSLPRTASAQFGAAKTHVPVSQAKPGDLVYWSNNGSGSGVYHVAVVIDGGKIAHARNPTMGVAVTDLDYSPWNMLDVAGRY
jgi:cell wall-associated NlpC family hydrolase